MMKATSSEITAQTIWNILQNGSREVSNSEYVFGLKMLYFRHKGYDTSEIAVPVEDIDDKIVELLNMYILMNDDIECTLQQFVESIPIGQFHEMYPVLLSELFRLRAFDLSHGSEITPPEINKLLSYLTITNGCESIYDPFCGSAGMLNFLPLGISYSGQDSERVSYIEACLLAEIHQGRISTSLSHENSVWNWGDRTYDGLVSVPPFSAFLKEEEKLAIEHETDVQCNFLEDLPMARGLRFNHAKVTITVLPYVFCFGNGHKNVIRFLVNNNFIDTVISLPRNILYGSGIKPIILICRKERLNEDPIRFIFADNYITGNSSRNQRLDVDRFIEDLNSSSNLIESYVSAKIIKQNDYVLIPEVYYPINQVGEDSVIVKLSNLLTQVQGQSNRYTECVRRIGSDILSGNVMEVILNTSRSSERKVGDKDFKFFANKDGQKYLIDLNLSGYRRYALQTSAEPFMCSRTCKVYSVNENSVDPEYLVYYLLSCNQLKLSTAPLCAMLDMEIPVIPMSRQKEVVKRLKDEYLQNKEKETEADRERLGKKTVQSEIEHMLGMNQQRVGRLLSFLNKTMPSEDDYFKYMKRLKDNFDYIERIIHFTNMPLESFNLSKGNLCAFIEDYVAAWHNYGPDYFNIQIDNHLECNDEVLIDKVLLTVMFDSILDNAGRHSFDKRKRIENKVVISLDCVNESGAPYIMVSVANNGKPFAEGFTIDDYISRGRYSASSGRSGLGGYHVYQVTKGHGGLLSISSNADWNVIIDVLIPAININAEHLPAYGKEYR